MVGGSALLHRLKTVDPGSNEHGLSPADAPQSFGSSIFDESQNRLAKRQFSAMMLLGSSSLGVVVVVFLELVCVAGIFFYVRMLYSVWL